MCESNFINNLKLCYVSIMQWYSVKLVNMYPDGGIALGIAVFSFGPGIHM